MVQVEIASCRRARRSILACSPIVVVQLDDAAQGWCRSFDAAARGRTRTTSWLALQRGVPWRGRGFGDGHHVHRLESIWDLRVCLKSMNTADADEAQLHALP